jgi:hypothetical protein
MVVLYPWKINMKKELKDSHTYVAIENSFVSYTTWVLKLYGTILVLLLYLVVHGVVQWMNDARNFVIVF